jgi:AcrR family transcriptional regulator
LRTVTKQTPRRQPRSDGSRKKILDAAIELLGEVGPQGLTLALTAERAEVSPGLPTYQFHTRHELLVAAATAVLEDDAPSQDLGLEPLLAWMRSELDTSAAGAGRLRARLVLLAGAPDPSTESAVAKHWSSRLDLLRRHLEHGPGFRQDLDRGAVAAALLGQLHGEMARLAWSHGPAGADVFLTLVRSSLAASRGPKREPQDRATKAGSGNQQKLF